MTVNELMEDVCALGFEKEISGELSFFTAANRALRFINSSLPAVKVKKLIVGGDEGSIVFESYRHTPGCRNSFSLSGSAFSFKANGSGSYTVCDADGEFSGSFDGEYSAVRGFLRANAKITFSGSEGFTVLNLTTFEGTFGGDEEKIPLYEDFRAVDISRIAPDFLSAAGPIEDSRGVAVKDSRISYGFIYIPRSYQGEISFYYNRRYKKILPEGEDTTVDILPEYEHLLPLLTASYLWLDDDEEKAGYYMNIYREELSRLRSLGERKIDTGYSDVLGWA